MKLSHLFLAAYTLLLAMLPCQDLPARPDDAFQNPVLAASHAHPHPQELVDLCSPFCTCACCAGMALSHPGKLLSVPGNAIIFANPAFSYRFHEGRIAGRIVWQPPRQLV